MYNLLAICKSFCLFVRLILYSNVYLLCVTLLALPDGTEAEVDLRLYKNAENETKLLTENKSVTFPF